MKSMLVVALLSVASVLAVGSLVANDTAESEKVDLTKIKCVVSGKAINPQATAEYKEAHVYFCCEGCPKAFAEDTKKFAAKANHQLVATKQAKQVACPMSGKELNAETTIEVSGVDVAFCCNNCKAAASKEEGAKQVELLFDDKKFEKGFKIAKKEQAAAAQ
jgi:hypothetical protein